VGPKKSQSGFKFLATMHRPHIEKFLATGALTLLVCRGICQSQPFQTPARTAPRAELASSGDPKRIAEHGQRAFAEGQYATAERDFQQLLKLGVRSASLFSNLGVVYLRTGRFDQAISAFLKAKALAPDVPGIRLNLGLAYFRKHQFKLAASNFGDVISSDPNNLQARYLKGICHFMMDDFHAAIAAFEPIQIAEQDDLEYLFMLGTSYGMLKRTDDSLRVFQRMVEAGGDTPHLHLLLGKAYLALNQLENAAVELKRATENASLPFAHYYLGVLNRQQGRLDLAATEFAQEIAIAPGNPSAYKDLAEIRLDQSDVQGAVQMLEKGVEHNPDAPDLLATLGRAYLQVPAEARAINVLKRAIALDPKSGNYHYQLGRAYLKAGRRAEAAAEMARARTLTNEAPPVGKMGALSKDQETDGVSDGPH